MKAKFRLRGLLCPKNRHHNLILSLRTTFFLLLLTLASNTILAQSRLRISGKVISALDFHALRGATIKTADSTSTYQTDQNGYFNLTTTANEGKLVISYLGYQTVELTYNLTNKGPFEITLEPASTTLEQVTVSTGFQQLPKERATGSFSVINNELFNRSVSTDVISRLNGVTSGLLFDRTADNNLGITVRGKSTIFANSQPLVILDNFPYEGDLNNLNPNDVESITVLKDAAAASIWGTRAGNGVIVITTKRGKFNQPLSVSLNSNVTVTDKPDLFYERRISASDFIGVEQFLFDNGKYDGFISDGITALTPAVEMMLNTRNGIITATEKDAQLNLLAQHDVRNDLSKYFYRTNINQQYALNLSGGSDKQQYYISGGWDKNLASLVGNSYDRISLNANNTYSLLNNRLEISTGMLYTKSNDRNNARSPEFGNGALYPYAALADEQGNALEIARYRNGFLGNQANPALLDWRYKPLDELGFADNTTGRTDYQVSLGVKYKLMPVLSAEVKYRYGNGTTENRNRNSQQTYFTRDLINSYSQVDEATGSLTRPVPLGDILSLSDGSYTSQNLRGQLNFDQRWAGRHQLTAIAGSEIGEVLTRSDSYRLYGYDPERETSLPVDFVNRFPNYLLGNSNTIYSRLGLSKLTNRTVSFFGNGAYSYLDRYTISASARSDGSNLFGVRTNQKWAPLWSVGTGWNISNEPFYHLDFLPSLKLRTTYGYNGNIDKNITAFLTTQVFGNNRYGAVYSGVLNPPKPDLTWERIGQLNIGLDFGFKNNVITGSIEYFYKKGKDMIGDAVLAPSSGYVSYRGNTAAIKGEGVDLTLNAAVLKGRVSWNIFALFSAARTVVTSYKVMPTTNGDYIAGSLPKAGRDLNGIFVYKWAGLDPLTGDPQSYLNGEVSKDYTKIIAGTNADDLEYIGTAAPRYYGSLMNSFNYGSFTLSVNLLYKLGYYFRRPSISYTSLFAGSAGIGHSDYVQRWQKPGDELLTNVPSLVYPANYNRDDLYLNSATLIEKGDHIRLQDIQMSYNLRKNAFAKLPFQNVKLYAVASNLGVVWRANKAGLDPDASVYPQPVSIAAGVKIDF